MGTTSRLGPLRACPENPRYFADGSGRAVYLTGSHNWSNFKDMGETDPPAPFDFAAYLDFLVAHNHNFFRLWAQELPHSTQGRRRPCGTARPSSGRARVRGWPVTGGRSSIC